MSDMDLGGMKLSVVPVAHSGGQELWLGIWDGGERELGTFRCQAETIEGIDETDVIRACVAAHWKGIRRLEDCRHAP